jgi:hypothetical protein
MKPPGIVVTSLLLTIGYAGMFAARPGLAPEPVIQRFTLPDRPVALNDAVVQRFLYGYAPVAATVLELGSDGEPEQRLATLDAKARELGFASYRNWQDTANTIMVTYHWATHPQPQQEVEKAIAVVPTMANVSEKEKSEMIAGLKSGLARVENTKPSPENLAVVEHRLRTLKPLYNQWLSQ